MMFLSDARQPEVAFLQFWGVILTKFSGKSSLLEERHLKIQIW